jgi:hypothetical protein
MPTNAPRIIFTVLVFLCALNLPVQGAPKKYPKNLFAVSLLHFDSVRTPHGLDWYLKSKEAQAIGGTISSALGIHPAFVMLANALPSGSVAGEETHYVLPLEEGYAYCATRVRVTSIVPAEGERASVINAAVNPKELQMTTWTPVRHSWEGKSWAEGDVQLYGIRPEYQEEFIKKGVCKRVTEQTGILSCRGRATCTPGVTHGDPLEAGPSTPDLTTGF